MTTDHSHDQRIDYGQALAEAVAFFAQERLPAGSDLAGLQRDVTWRPARDLAYPIPALAPDAR